MSKIAIVGTGISGLTCANYLKSMADVTLFEKARGVGGRMATRRADPFCFDHGAQYFTANTIDFKRFIKPMLDNKVLVPWRGRFVEFRGDTIVKIHSSNYEDIHYIGTPGMNSMAKYLSEGLDIKLSTRITSINKFDDLWQLQSEGGGTYLGFDWVIITAPAKQTYELMPRQFKYYNERQDHLMTSCISVMLGLDTSLDLDFDCAKIFKSDIDLISVNSNKPDRKNRYSLLIQSAHRWADLHMNDSKDSILTHLCQETSQLLRKDVSKAVHKDVHFWRYAKGTKRQEASILIDNNSKLAACGDWCLDGSVESAFTAALNVSSDIRNVLSNE
jgi:renalase